MAMEALLEDLRYPEDGFASGLPTMDDLPSEYPEDPGMPDVIHPPQANLLKECLLISEQARQLDPYLISSELNIHFNEVKPHWHRRPDFFLALGIKARLRNVKRKSFLIWQEQVRPYLVVEILSKSTAGEDLGQVEPKGRIPSKWKVYQNILKVPNYVCFDHDKGVIYAFRLVAGKYQKVTVEENGFWLPDINVGLKIWEGQYQDLFSYWLRFCDRFGKQLPTESEEKNRERKAKEKAMGREKNARAAKNLERAAKERERAAKERERAAKEEALAGEAKERAEKERERAEKERERAEKERLLVILKQAGIDPNQG